MNIFVCCLALTTEKKKNCFCKNAIDKKKQKNNSDYVNIYDTTVSDVGHMR